MRIIHRRIMQALTGVAAATVLTAGVGAQTANFVSRDAADVPTIKGAPFSGDAVITLKLSQYDGTKIERSVTGKYYRDSEGRVRREQLVVGLGQMMPNKDSQGIVTIVDPVAGFVYTIVGGQREVQRLPIVKVAVPTDMGAAGPIGVEVGQKAEPLGTRQIEGVSATGTKTTLTIPPGLMGNERPVDVVEERWVSPELKLVLLSRQHNPFSGETEYRMANIRRAEPAAELFKVPAGYKIVDITRAPISRGP